MRAYEFRREIRQLHQTTQKRETKDAAGFRISEREGCHLSWCLMKALREDTKTGEDALSFPEHADWEMSIPRDFACE